MVKCGRAFIPESEGKKLPHILAYYSSYSSIFVSNFVTSSEYVLDVLGGENLYFDH